MVGRYSIQWSADKKFSLWRDEKLMNVKPNKIMRGLGLWVLIDYQVDGRIEEIKINPSKSNFGIIQLQKFMQY